MGKTLEKIVLGFFLTTSLMGQGKMWPAKKWDLNKDGKKEEIFYTMNPSSTVSLEDMQRGAGNIFDYTLYIKDGKRKAFETRRFNFKNCYQIRVGIVEGNGKYYKDHPMFDKYPDVFVEMNGRISHFISFNGKDYSIYNFSLSEVK